MKTSVHRFTEITADRIESRQAVQKRLIEYSNLSNDFIDLAIRRFMALRELSLRKRPSTSELLVWLRVLSLVAATRRETNGLNLSDLNVGALNLPHINTLIKDKQDYEELA